MCMYCMRELCSLRYSTYCRATKASIVPRPVLSTEVDHRSRSDILQSQLTAFVCHEKQRKIKSPAAVFVSSPYKLDTK